MSNRINLEKRFLSCKSSIVQRELVMKSIDQLKNNMWESTEKVALVRRIKG